MLKFLLAALFALVSTAVLAGQIVVLPLAARTATNTSAVIIKSTEQAAHFIINVTAVPGTDTITPTIQGVDALGNSYTLLTGTAISTTGITALKIGRGMTGVANASASDLLPDQYKVLMTHSAGSSFTYSVTANQGN